MTDTFKNTNVFTTTFAGRKFFYFYADGIETPLTKAQFDNLVNAGARIIDVTPA